MGYGFKHGTGGSNPLNFRVLGGTTQPASPRENDIWVNTSTNIPQWIMSPIDPLEANILISLPAGTAWIQTSSDDSLVFNALKKNGLYVCPVSCKQYIDSEWADLEAYACQGGEWVQFSDVIPPYFYKDGEMNVAFLGDGTNSDGYLTLTAANGLREPEAYFVIPDIEKYSTISCVISSYSNFTPIVYIRQISSGTNVATARPSAQGETISVDLSGLGLSGNDYYFVLHTEAVWNSTGTTNGYWTYGTVKTNHIWGA